MRAGQGSSVEAVAMKFRAIFCSYRFRAPSPGSSQSSWARTRVYARAKSPPAAQHAAADRWCGVGMVRWNLIQRTKHRSAGV